MLAPVWPNGYPCKAKLCVLFFAKCYVCLFVYKLKCEDKNNNCTRSKFCLSNYRNDWKIFGFSVQLFKKSTYWNDRSVDDFLFFYSKHFFILQGVLNQNERRATLHLVSLWNVILLSWFGSVCLCPLCYDAPLL